MADSSGGRGRTARAELDSVLNQFLGGLSSDAQEALSRNVRQVSYGKGSTVRMVASRPRPGIVVDGLLRAYVATAAGREVTVTYARPGYPIGILSQFMAESPLGLEAIEDTTVLYFDARQFDRLAATDMTVAHIVGSWMADDIVGTANTLLSFAFGSVRSRLAAHLLSIARPDAGGVLAAQVTQQQLADAIGSARQVVARALSDLVSEGLVSTHRGEVLINDEASLQRDATPR
jgi:CRP/FNR family cyclic AMP-dependent transcriptional regulator